MAKMFSERVTKTDRLEMPILKVLAEEKSEYQDIMIFESAHWGKVLVLDGVLQLTTLDQHIYHEMMVHPAMMAKKSSENNLTIAIIGGGDGGVLKEVLKYSFVERATLIDIDGRVVDLSKEFLPEISSGAFDDPRAVVHIGDGKLWLEEAAPGSLDIIFIDSSDDDDDGPNSSLFSAEFYSILSRTLKPDGIVVKQSGMTQIQQKGIMTTMKHMKSFCTNFGSYTANVPTYVGGNMTFGWGTNGPNLETIEVENCPVDTSFYHHPIHKACFALPKKMHDDIDAIRKLP
jgi:spermidine synthase